MSNLAAHISQTRLIDTHEHLYSEQQFVEEGPDLLQLVIPTASLSIIIAVAMLGITVFSLTNHTAGVKTTRIPSRKAEWCGYGVTFILGIYGGFFSGGYVTILTLAYVALFGMTYIEAIAITKVINIFSSAFSILCSVVQLLIENKLYNTIRP